LDSTPPLYQYKKYKYEMVPNNADGTFTKAAGFKHFIFEMSTRTRDRPRTSVCAAYSCFNTAIDIYFGGLKYILKIKLPNQEQIISPTYYADDYADGDEFQIV
jgi:hypothetical protein